MTAELRFMARLEREKMDRNAKMLAQILSGFRTAFGPNVKPICDWTDDEIIAYARGGKPPKRA